MYYTEGMKLAAGRGRGSNRKSPSPTPSSSQVTEEPVTSFTAPGEKDSSIVARSDVAENVQVVVPSEETPRSEVVEAESEEAEEDGDVLEQVDRLLSEFGDDVDEVEEDVEV